MTDDDKYSRTRKIEWIIITLSALFAVACLVALVLWYILAYVP